MTRTSLALLALISSGTGLAAAERIILKTASATHLRRCTKLEMA